MQFERIPKRPSRSPAGIRIFKILVSVFLIYHLATVSLFPNSGSLAGRSLSHYFLTYANTLGFNTTWQFFSPGPSPVFYLEYQIQTEADPESFNSEIYTYPPMREGHSWSDSYNRRLYGMRFFALNPERLEKYLVPFLCRQTEGARSIYVQSIFEKVPNIERADQWDDFSDMKERVDVPRQYFSCPLENESADSSGSHDE